MSPHRPLTYCRSHGRRFVAQLQEFVRFPSVSAQPAHAADVARCAAWLAEHLRHSGLERVRVIPTPRHPIVYADWLRAPGRPTVLIYGHYDVQPADPLSEWRTPPFEPVVRGDDLYGRGASDDKGPLFAHVKALEAYLQTAGRLPVNARCLFEGEEEIGSTHLPAFLRRNRRALAADVAVMSDTRILAPDRPVITYALRGGLGLELEVRGPRQDLHSGGFGGAVHDPLQVLCELIGKLHDARGRVAIPGFYRSVRPVGAGERASLARVGPGTQELLRDAGVDKGWGEPGFSLYERIALRPALTVNGLTGGYQGPGGKSIIPARATAKLSFRLVPDQDPRVIDRLFRRHVARATPPTVRCTVRTLSMAFPVLIDRRHPALRAAAVAYRQGFGAAPVFLRSGGTIPIVNTLQEVLGLSTVLMGFALPDDRMHGPNEKFHLPNFQNGMATCVHFLAAVARAQPGWPGRRPVERAAG